MSVAQRWEAGGLQLASHRNLEDLVDRFCTELGRKIIGQRMTQQRARQRHAEYAEERGAKPHAARQQTQHPPPARHGWRPANRRGTWKLWLTFVIVCLPDMKPDNSEMIVKCREMVVVYLNIFSAIRSSTLFGS